MGDVKRAVLASLFLIVFATLANRNPQDNPGVYVMASDDLAPALSAPAPRKTRSTPAAPEGYVYWKTVVAKVTAYEPSKHSCGKYADGKTSLLDNAWKLDGVAVDPDAIPYRTIIHIPGVGFKEADDTGAAMKKSWKNQGIHHIDLRMTYVSQAKNWGVRWMLIDLYKKS